MIHGIVFACIPRAYYIPVFVTSCGNDIVLKLMIVLTPSNPEKVQFWEDESLVGAALQ